MLAYKDTLLLNVETGEYPVHIGTVQRRTNGFSFGEYVDESILNELGYAVVHRIDPPAGVDVREIAPVKTEGGYTQAYAEYVKTQTDLDSELHNARLSRLAELENLLWETQSKGVPFNFGTETVPNIQHIQIRDQDLVNLLGLKASAELAPGAIHPLRTYENIVLMLEAPVILNAVVFARTSLTTVLKNYWTVKDDLLGAVSVASLPDIPNSLTQ